NNSGNSGLPSHYPLTGDWLPMVKWQWNMALPVIEAAPTVAPLIDTNGDGRIDARDVPAVIVNSAGGAAEHLPALPGATGQVIFDAPIPADVSSHSLPTVGDLDGDGRPEILLDTLGGRLDAFNNDGTLKWTSPPVSFAGPHPVLVDLDGDGKSEVLFGAGALNSDGTLRWDASALGQHSWGYLGGGGFADWAMQPADLNLDGIPEIIAGPSALDRNGRMLWSWRTLGDSTTNDYVAQLSVNDGPFVD